MLHLQDINTIDNLIVKIVYARERKFCLFITFLLFDIIAHFLIAYVALFKIYI